MKTTVFFICNILLQILYKLGELIAGLIAAALIVIGIIFGCDIIGFLSFEILYYIFGFQNFVISLMTAFKDMNYWFAGVPFGFFVTFGFILGLAGISFINPIKIIKKIKNYCITNLKLAKTHKISIHL